MTASVAIWLLIGSVVLSAIVPDYRGPLLIAGGVCLGVGYAIDLVSGRRRSLDAAAEPKPTAVSLGAIRVNCGLLFITDRWKCDDGVSVAVENTKWLCSGETISDGNDVYLQRIDLIPDSPATATANRYSVSVDTGILILGDGHVLTEGNYEDALREASTEIASDDSNQKWRYLSFGSDDCLAFAPPMGNGIYTVEAESDGSLRLSLA